MNRTMLVPSVLEPTEKTGLQKRVRSLPLSQLEEFATVQNNMHLCSFFHRYDRVRFLMFRILADKSTPL